MKSKSGLAVLIGWIVLFAALILYGKSNNNSQNTAVDETVAFESSTIVESTISGVHDTDQIAGTKEDSISTEPDTVETTESSVPDNNGLAQLEVHFIDVGQGDAILIKCDNEAMLIDAGDNNKGTTVQLYLQKQGISDLKYIIGTHPDADHIGGLDVIITKYNITSEEVWMPDVAADTETYRDVIAAIDYKSYKKLCPAIGSTYSLGDATITILAPGTTTYSDDNNNSIVVRLDHGDSSFLFTGDAEEEAEVQLIKNGNIDVDVLKIGHHGSRSSTTDDFLQSVSPTYAVISVGEDNKYGHPTAEVLNRLRAANVKLYRTDEQGSIIATSDGKEITWNAAPTESWKAGENVSSSTESKETSNQQTNESNGTSSEYGSAPEGAVYIGNTNNMKLHRAECSSLPQAQNQILFDSLEEAKNAGYTKDNQCKRCKPFGE